MITDSKVKRFFGSIAACGLVACAMGTIVAPAANAQASHSVRHHQYHKAKKLYGKAAAAAASGHYRAAHRLNKRANRLKAAAKHGH